MPAGNHYSKYDGASRTYSVVRRLADGTDEVIEAGIKQASGAAVRAAKLNWEINGVGWFA